MKKNKTLRITLVSTACLLFGVLLALLGYYHGARGVYWSKTGLHSAANQTKITLQLNDVNSIFADLADCSIELIPSDHFYLEYSKDAPHSLTRAEVEGGTLYLEGSSGLSFNFLFTAESPVRLYYPVNAMLDKVSIKTSSGSVRAEHVNSNSFYVNGLEINCTSGSVHLSGVDAGKASVKTSSGSIRMEQCSFETLECRASSGSITGSGVKGALDCSASSGSIRLEDITTPSLSLSASSGSIRAQGVCTGESELKATSGSVRFINHVPLGSCSYRLEATSGSCRVNDGRAPNFAERAGSVNQVTMSATSGSVRLYLDD